MAWAGAVGKSESTVVMIVVARELGSWPTTVSRRGLSVARCGRLRMLQRGRNQGGGKEDQNTVNTFSYFCFMSFEAFHAFCRFLIVNCVIAEIFKLAIF